MATQEEKVGLEHLSDATLAAIVEGDIRDNDDLKSQEACRAFAELARRSDQ